MLDTGLVRIGVFTLLSSALSVSRTAFGAGLRRMLRGVVGPLLSQDGDVGSIRRDVGTGLGLVCSLGPVGLRPAELGVLLSSTESALWRC